MAETKAKARTQKAKPKARGSTKAKPRAAKAKGTRSKPRKRAASKPAASKPAASKPQAVREAVESTAKDAGGAVSSAAGKVGHAASKAKVPLMASGAAIAGAAGGLALGARHTHRKNGLGKVGSKVSSKDLAKAARKAGNVGAQVGEIALEVKRARERTNGNGGTHRSPIEVVLQGLTSRGSRE